MTDAKITGTVARFTGIWVVTLAIGPRSVPDRPVGGGRAVLYQPEELKMEFRTSAVHGLPRMLSPEHERGTMRTARDRIVLASVTVCGRRLSAAGAATSDWEETIMAHEMNAAPDWVQAAVTAALGELRGAG